MHPDKNRDGSPEQVYIAQRVFDALNQAWSKFQDQQNAMANPCMMCAVCWKGVQETRQRQLPFEFRLFILSTSELLKVKQSG